MTDDIMVNYYECSGTVMQDEQTVGETNLDCVLWIEKDGIVGAGRSIGEVLRITNTDEQAPARMLEITRATPDWWKCAASLEGSSMPCCAHRPSNSVKGIALRVSVFIVSRN